MFPILIESIYSLNSPPTQLSILRGGSSAGCTVEAPTLGTGARSALLVPIQTGSNRNLLFGSEDPIYFHFLVPTFAHSPLHAKFNGGPRWRRRRDDPLGWNLGAGGRALQRANLPSEACAPKPVFGLPTGLRIRKKRKRKHEKTF